MTDAVHVTAVGRPVRLGKQAKQEDKRTLKISDYLSPALPAPPDAVDHITKVQQLLPTGWGMMGNDQLGDCTIAAEGHAVQVWTALGTTKPHTPSDHVIERKYWMTGTPPSEHGQPNGPTDDGRTELGVLNDFRKKGLDRHHILAFAEVNPSHTDYVKQTINLFGLSYIGLALPRSAQGQSLWDITAGPDAEPGSWGGHAVILPNYDTIGPTCITWGQTLKMTWAFFEMYCDESYAIIAKDWVHNGKAPSGFDLPALQADLQEVTN